MSEQKVTARQEGRIAVIQINNPPVNALSHAVRIGLQDAVSQSAESTDTDAIVIIGNDRAFSGGADITEFDKPMQEPALTEVISQIEALEKPVIAAIPGLALGGGLELALGCHFRVALENAFVGLPEVKLGLLPGGGGTQRLPRIIGPVAALRPIITGSHIPAPEARELGLLDEIFDGDLMQNAVNFANAVVQENRPILRSSERTDKLQGEQKEQFETEAQKLLKKTRGLEAPVACADCIRATLTLSFEEGTKIERELFIKLRDGEQSKAQRHLFFAERAAQKISDMPRETKTRPINKVAVLGAGTMGGGITMSLASAGLPVTMIDLDDKALERGLGIIEKNYRKTAARGGFTDQQVEKALGLITGSTNFDDVSDADLVIEAVFEDMDLKKKIFKDLDEKVKAGAILASNTSYLDINELAATTSRPGDVIGMHFFSPANVMKLLEVVRGEKTGLDVLKTAVDLGKRMRKIPVVVGVCYGFVGNRMLKPRGKQLEKLLIEGASPSQIDRVSTEFGFAMGPCAVGDLAGLDIGWRARKETQSESPVIDVICELGRFGQKTGKGFYIYEEGSRIPTPDPEIDLLIEKVASDHGVQRREISDQEIHERLVFTLINEGAKILDEGIAQRSSDIDLIWINGYGWPIGRGGPMFYADSIGLGVVAKQLAHYAAATGDEELQPSALLQKLADSNGAFGDL